MKKILSLITVVTVLIASCHKDVHSMDDNNGNGKWDYGKFFGEKRQPERVQALGKKINIKANWDNEIEINL